MSDIAMLFATDPLKLTKEDRRQIIQAMREGRQKFLAPAVPKPGKVSAAGKKLTLDDLGSLDI